MSLDVYLRGDSDGVATRTAKIFIRENGQRREITRAEWDERNPGREPLAIDTESDFAIYSSNITHNLGKMASEAGLYAYLWRPDENGITEAAQLIGPLKTGLELLRSDPGRFKTFNPENGWGDYDGLVNFVVAYLAACEEFPFASVEVSR